MPRHYNNDKVEYISHPLIEPDAIEFREYQWNIVDTCMDHNTMVILPTALGKTIISLLVAVNKLDDSKSKVLILAPTRPLTLQHYETFKKFLNVDEEKLVFLTGKIMPEKREDIWKNATIIFATPQLIRNDVLSDRYSLENVSLIVFDEAHRARKKYAYNQIAESYMDQCPNPLILGLTASPGKDRDVIKKTCENLFIERVEYRTEKDGDVKPYIPPLAMRWKKTGLPREYKDIRKILEGMLQNEVKKLQSMGILTYRKPLDVTKTDLLKLGKSLRIKLGEKGKSMYAAIMFQSSSISLLHMIELLTTQDVWVLYRFLKNTERKAKKTKSARKIVNSPDYKKLVRKVENYLAVEHPKLNVLRETIEKEYMANENTSTIVFTQFRDTATRIIKSLKEIEMARPIRFVGQASKHRDKGLTQDRQAEIIREFEDGVYNILVATSIAEEGLDIPSVDVVIFYEPVPSEIRLIQRKGRTARKRFGKVVILITENTVDEAYYWASKTREKKMRGIVSSLNEILKESRESKTKTKEEEPQKVIKLEGQRSIDDF